MIFIHTDTIQRCRIEHFLSIEYRCFYEKKIINMENNEAVTLSITVGYMKNKLQSFGLSKKNQKSKKELFHI